MTTCGIYKIINKINGRFYIGSSDNIERRFNRHFLDLRKNKHDNQHLQNAWNKYGKEAFMTEVVKSCRCEDLLLEEQKELDIWVGNTLCYNLSKIAGQPVSPGEKRPQWIVDKISATQKGKPRWTNEQKQQMSIDRQGRTHSTKTKEKMRGRNSSFENIAKAQASNIGRVYSEEHCLHISNGKCLNPKVFSEEEKTHISSGVRKAILEGRYHKNKIPKEEYCNIRDMYMSGNINKKQLAFKYGVNPCSIARLLKRIGL